jgi:hypothetical protein
VCGKKWREVYKNKEMIKGIYGGFETWLNKYGREITLAKILTRLCIP